MIIELTGYTGSGKSTLLQTLVHRTLPVELLDDIYTTKDLQSLESSSHSTKLLGYIAHLLNPANIIIIFDILYTHSFSRYSFRSVRWLLETLTLYHKAANLEADNPKALIILDEGYIHRIFSSYVSQSTLPSQSQVSRFLRNIPSKQITCFLVSSVKTNFLRLEERGWSPRLELLSMEEKLQCLVNMSRTQQTIMQLLPRHLCIESTLPAETSLRMYELVSKYIT